MTFAAVFKCFPGFSDRNVGYRYHGYFCRYPIKVTICVTGVWLCFPPGATYPKRCSHGSERLQSYAPPIEVEQWQSKALEPKTCHKDWATFSLKRRLLPQNSCSRRPRSKKRP